MEYALDYCYVQNTYFVPFTEEKAHNAFDFGAHVVPIPKNITHREEKLIGLCPFLHILQVTTSGFPSSWPEWLSSSTCQPSSGGPSTTPQVPLTLPFRLPRL